MSATLNVPTWRQLIDHIGRELEYDPDIFAAPSADYLILAEYYKLQKGSIGPLRSWMDKNLNVSDEAISKSDVHDLIVNLNFPIIYTTNYDGNLESAFRGRNQKYTRIVDVRDIAKIRDGETQIVKFHGDFESDDSIVLTETDYFDRLSFESPLDIKLRSDALAKTILFIGYSLSDVNIRLLLHKLWKAWAGYEKFRPRSYIFLPRPDPVQEAVLGQWDVSVLTEDVDDPKTALAAFLRRLLQEMQSEMS